VSSTHVVCDLVHPISMYSGEQSDKLHNMKVLRSRASAATLLIWSVLGSIFLSEGIQEFLFPGQLGVDRFQKIGIPSPEVLAIFASSGVPAMAQEARADFSMLLVCLFLLIMAGGPVSLDVKAGREIVGRREPPFDS